MKGILAGKTGPSFLISICDPSRKLLSHKASIRSMLEETLRDCQSNLFASLLHSSVSSNNQLLL